MSKPDQPTTREHQAMRVRTKFVDLDAFIEKFATHITGRGLFLPTRTTYPVGTALRFELQLANGTSALRGEGEVIWIKPFDPAQPSAPHGIGISFVRLDGAGRQVVTRALAHKEKQKRSPSPPPIPSDAAPRSTAPTPLPPTREEAPVLGSEELELLASEWAISPDQIAQTLARVRGLNLLDQPLSLFEQIDELAQAPSPLPDLPTGEALKRLRKLLQS